MKKYNILITIFAATMFFHSYDMVGQVQDPRNVLWGHGLNRTSTAWDLYAAHFQNTRVLASANTSYTTDNGMIPAKASYRHEYTQLLGVLESVEGRNIGIAQDIGGLVDRDLDQSLLPAEQLHGGYISIGTPHAGMEFANSYIQGKVQDFTNDACNKLTDGIAAFTTVNFSGAFSGFEPVDICNLAQSYADSHYNNSTAQDIQEGSNYIGNLLAQNPTSTPKANISGSENSPVHWRFLSSITVKPFELQLDETEESLVEGINSLREDYRVRGKRRTNGGILWTFVIAPLAFTGAIGSTVNGDPVPGFVGGIAALVAGIDKFSDATKLKRAKRWIDDSESKWGELIGTSVFQTISYTTTEFVCDELISENLSYTLLLDLDCWEEIVNNTTVAVQLKNDGLLTEDATLFAQLPPGCNFVADEANHEQLVNHPNVKQHLNTILDGNCNLFFLTAKN